MAWTESLDVDTCLALLRGGEVGRIAVIEDSRPLIFPVNYVLDGEAVVLRTGSGAKLWAATRAPVAFEVDSLVGDTPWSVVVTGVAYEITSADEPDVIERIHGLPLHPLAPGDKPYYLRIAATEISGRRIRHDRSA